MRGPDRHTGRGLPTGSCSVPEQLGQDDMRGCSQVPFRSVLLGERIFDGPTDHVTMHNTASARGGHRAPARDRPPAHRGDRRRT